MAADLPAILAHRRSNARAHAFVAQGGGCRATFFNDLRAGARADVGGGGRTLGEDARKVAR
jgi:hypothetical protein